MVEYGVIYRQPDGVIYRRYLNGSLQYVEYVHLPETLPADHYSNNLNSSEILFVQRVRGATEDAPDMLSILEKCELTDDKEKSEIECIDEIEQFEMVIAATALRIEEETKLGFGHTLH